MAAESEDEPKHDVDVIWECIDLWENAVIVGMKGCVSTRSDIMRATKT